MHPSGIWKQLRSWVVFQISSRSEQYFNLQLQTNQKPRVEIAYSVQKQTMWSDNTFSCQQLLFWTHQKLDLLFCWAFSCFRGKCSVEGHAAKGVPLRYGDPFPQHPPDTAEPGKVAGRRVEKRLWVVAERVLPYSRDIRRFWLEQSRYWREHNRKMW